MKEQAEDPERWGMRRRWAEGGQGGMFG